MSFPRSLLVTLAVVAFSACSQIGGITPTQSSHTVQSHTVRAKSGVSTVSSACDPSDIACVTSTSPTWGTCDASNTSGCGPEWTMSNGGGSSGSTAAGGGSTASPTPDPSPEVVACNGTAPQCQNVPCSGSPETIGDYFHDNNSDTHQVRDINSLWQGGTEVGWMYLADDGKRYMQFNYATQAGKSLGVSWGFGNFSVSSPGGYSDIRVWTGGLPSGTAVQKCESQGATLV